MEFEEEPSSSETDIDAFVAEYRQRVHVRKIPPPPPPSIHPPLDNGHNSIIFSRTSLSQFRRRKLIEKEINNHYGRKLNYIIQ